MIMMMFREDVVIAKMDATANEVDGFEIQGFPTLKLIKKDTNEIVSYQGRTDSGADPG